MRGVSASICSLSSILAIMVIQERTSEDIEKGATLHASGRLTGSSTAGLENHRTSPDRLCVCWRGGGGTRLL